MGFPVSLQIAQQVWETDSHSETIHPSVAASELGKADNGSPGVMSTVFSEHVNRPATAVRTGSQHKYLTGLETRKVKQQKSEQM